MGGVCLALCDLRHGRTVRSSAYQRGRLGPRLTRSRRLCLRSLTWATSLVALLLGPPMRLDTTRAPSRKAGLSCHMDRRVPPTPDMKPMRSVLRRFRNGGSCAERRSCPLEAKRPGQGAQGGKVRSSKVFFGTGGSVCPAVGRSPGEGDQAYRLRHVTDDKSLSNWHTQAVAERTHGALKAPPHPTASLFMARSPYSSVQYRTKQSGGQHAS
jgi:hypothetical protein